MLSPLLTQTKINPFSNPNQPIWTPYEVFKVVVLLPVALLRAAILVVLLLVLGIVCRVATCGCPIECEEGCYYHAEPLPRWRSFVLLPLYPLVFLMRACFGFYSLKVVDHRKDKSKAPRIIVCGPHQTDVDILMINSVFWPIPSGVGDANILKAPFVNWVGMATQGIFVNLKSPKSRHVCRRVMQERASDDWTGPPLLVFPEGRMTNGQMLIQFRHGAFAPAQPVTPVLLRYPFNYFNPTGQSRANRSFTWPLRILTQFINHCEVEILEPIAPTEEERADAGRFAETVRARMAESLDVPTTEHSYDDAALFLAACDLSASRSVTGDFVVKDVREKLDLDINAIADYLKAFRTLDKNGDGVVDRKEFAQLPYLFDFFDEDKNGTIEYREFLQFVALLDDNIIPTYRASMTELA